MPERTSFRSVSSSEISTDIIAKFNGSNEYGLFSSTYWRASNFQCTAHDSEQS